MAKTAKIIKIAALIVAVGFVALTAYVRSVEVDMTQFHVTLEFDQPSTGSNFAARLIQPSSQEQFDRLITLIEASPRITILNADTEQNHLTYVTRTALVGFPDVITVSLEGDILRILSRAYFGPYDYGVNTKRVDAWLASL